MFSSKIFICRRRLVTVVTRQQTTVAKAAYSDITATLKERGLWEHVGGATALVGDPSGRITTRKQSEKGVIENNVIGITNDLKKVFENANQCFPPTEAYKLEDIKVINNREWYRDYDPVTFLTEIGRFFRMGFMLRSHTAASRLASEEGMSFAEFAYPVMQGYDFYKLHQSYNCLIQLGGRDQFGNIYSGIDLISKKTTQKAYGITLPIITEENGVKYGKSVGNAVWLSAKKFSPYQLYQFFMQGQDIGLDKLLNQITLIPFAEIKDIISRHKLEPHVRHAQKALARHITLLVHGEKGLILAEKATNALFGKKNTPLNLNEILEVLHQASTSHTISKALIPETALLDLTLRTRAFKSRGATQRAIHEGAIHMNEK
eukprot:Ihof_evm9s28 gene=Ihof_evmTU9s28